MADFSVDLGGLGALRANLRRGADNLDGALSQMENIGVGSLGTRSLDDACLHFHEKWTHGLGLLRECVTQVDTGLADNQRMYAELETALHQAFTTMGQTMGAPTNSPGGQPGVIGDGPMVGS